LISNGILASNAGGSDDTDTVMVVSDGSILESLDVTSLLHAAAAAAHALSSCQRERNRPLASNAARSCRHENAKERAQCEKHADSSHDFEKEGMAAKAGM
jgi:hypothetical protein